MKCPDTQQWILLTMGAFNDRRTAELEAHAQGCPACRRELELARREHADLEAAHRLFERRHDAGRERLMAKLADAVVMDTASQSSGTSAPPVRRIPFFNNLKIGDFLMNLSVRRPGRIAVILAPAACIIAAIAVYSGMGDGRAFADAIARLREADTVACHVRMTMHALLEPAAGADVNQPGAAQITEKHEQTLVRDEQLYLSAAGGVRRDAFENDKPATTVYVAPNAVRTWIINHVDSTWQEFGDEATAAMPEELKDAMRDLVADRPMVELHFGGALDDTAQLIEGLRTLAGDADRPLGERRIDGVSATGYEIDGARVGFGPPLYSESDDNRAEVWIDLRQDLPVLIVLHFVSRVNAVAGMPINATYTVTTEYSHFQIDPPLAADWFDPVIPVGYSQKQDQVVKIAGSLNEVAFLEALRAFGEQAGRYPKSLETMDVMYEVSYLIGSMQARRLAATSKGEPTDNLPDHRAVGQAVQGLAYYTVLEAAGRRPEYFGTSVTPGDTAALLLRWTLEDGRTRVVYGDLRVDDVDAG
ncbi:MAG: hypothetical protein C4547_06330 [Phycisphaerales bacterium]|nr:MAG: hypothetical protein C4547_06330 [Phycisphaerales bacterium]